MACSTAEPTRAGPASSSESSEHPAPSAGDILNGESGFDLRCAGELGLLLFLCGSAAFSQRLVSARAGTVNYVRGAAYIDGQRVALPRNKLLVLKNGQTLRTQTGRVELLLGEGVFLRMGGGGSLRMDENRMPDTRLSLEDGFALIEVVQIAKDARLRISCGDRTTELKAPGLYRFDANPGGLRIYNGEISIENGGGILKAKGGQAVNLTGEPALYRFDPNETDPLKAWADQRSLQRIRRQKRQQEERAMQRAKRQALMQ
jgi:hypothetical protein